VLAVNGEIVRAAEDIVIDARGARPLGVDLGRNPLTGLHD
jgi:hypothetical protein